MIPVLENNGLRWKKWSSINRKVDFSVNQVIINNYMTITWQLHVYFLEAFFVDSCYEEVLCYAHVD